MSDFVSIDALRDETEESARLARLAIDRLRKEVDGGRRLLFLAVEAAGGTVEIPDRAMQEPLDSRAEIRRERDLDKAITRLTVQRRI